MGDGGDVHHQQLGCKMKEMKSSEATVIIMPPIPTMCKVVVWLRKWLRYLAI